MLGNWGDKKMNCKNCGAPLDSSGMCSYCGSNYNIRIVDNVTNSNIQNVAKPFGKWINNLEQYSPQDWYDNYKSLKGNGWAKFAILKTGELFFTKEQIDKKFKFCEV